MGIYSSLLKLASYISQLGAQWRNQDLILGGGGGNMRGSEATEPERAERARGRGVSPSHGREIFWKFVYENGIFFHTK